jgi:hypothetical protein
MHFSHSLFPCYKTASPGPQTKDAAFMTPRKRPPAPVSAVQSAPTRSRPSGTTLARAASLLLPVVLSALLTACVTTADQPQAPKPSVVDTEIARGTTEILRRLDELARSQAARAQPPLPAPTPSQIPPDLQTLLTLDATGPIDAVARAVAKPIGYAVVPHRVPPAVPIVVSIHAANERAYELFARLGTQAGARADLVVDAPNRVVKIIYPAPER